MKILLLFFFAMNFITAQKVVSKSIIDNTISSFQIDASNCFQIHIETSETNEVEVIALIDGEYKKDLMLNVTEKNAEVFINAGFQPNFKNPNDKLSAHKVVSIALEIKIPKYKNVRIYGSTCNVNANGEFEKLKVTLNDGTCRLSNVIGVADVRTQSGTIFAASNAAEISANSKYGKVDDNHIPVGNTKYTFNTVTGSIYLKRIE